MRVSRGMGKINTDKMPKPKKVLRKDALDPTKVFAEGGEVGMAARFRKMLGMPTGGRAAQIDAAEKAAVASPPPPPPKPAKKDLSVEDIKFKKGGWVKSAIKKPGALHEDLGVPKGQKIPAGRLAAAAKKPGKTGQRARLAQTMSKWKK